LTIQPSVEGLVKNPTVQVEQRRSFLKPKTSHLWLRKPSMTPQAAMGLRDNGPMTEAYQPLHHKYRPKRLDELVGQEAIAATLGNALRSGRIAPAYLFSGPRGTGKTSSARILARSLNCLASEHPTPEPCGRCELCRSIASGTALDVIEIDAASNTGVDNIRELIERSRFAPVQARWKVYVVDECHMLSTAAFNALLKTLEEPPPQVVFVLATTDPQRVLPTILSRCQRFDFRRIPLASLETHLGWIAEQEKIAITPEALHLVAQRAQGGLRDAESLLDQLSLLPAPIDAAAVWDLLGAVPEEELLRLVQAMAEGSPLTVVEGCRRLLERGREPNAVLQGITSLLRDVLLAGVAPERLDLTSVSTSLKAQLPPLARSIGKERLLHWHAALKGSEQQLRQSAQPRLWLEVIFLGLLAEPEAVPSRKKVDARVETTPETKQPSPPPPQTQPEQSTPGPSAAGSHQPQAELTAARSEGRNLEELWQQILAGLQLPSTRMLLSQQAQLRLLDDRRAVVRVSSNWITMVQSRLPLLEKAVEATLGSPRQITLEAGDHESPVLQRSNTSSSVDPSPQNPPVVSNEAPPTEKLAQEPPLLETRSAAVDDRADHPKTGAPVGEISGLETQQPTNNSAEAEGVAQEVIKESERQQPAERLLDQSTTLLADFFNGQVIIDEA